MRSWIAVAIVSVSAATVAAEVRTPVDLAAHSKGAGKIVVARVTDVHSTFATNRFGDQLIVSNAVLEVLETLKGAPDAVTSVTYEGGTVGDLTLKVSDITALKEGDRAVFFLDANGNGHAPHDRGRGMMKLDANDRVPAYGVDLDQIRSAVRQNNGKAGR